MAHGLQPHDAVPCLRARAKRASRGRTLWRGAWRRAWNWAWGWAFGIVAGDGDGEGLGVGLFGDGDGEGIGEGLAGVWVLGTVHVHPAAVQAAWTALVPQTGG